MCCSPPPLLLCYYLDVLFPPPPTHTHTHMHSLPSQVFDIVDANHNGTIEDIEVEVAILQLYNRVNKRLPGWQDPPNRETIRVCRRIPSSLHPAVLHV